MRTGLAILALVFGSLAPSSFDRPASPSDQRGSAAPPPQTPAPTGQRGGGRGRGGVQIMSLNTTAWVDGGDIPARHAQQGDVSPPLSWSGAPEGTASFALIVSDLDAMTNMGRDTTLHWMVWNIPPTATSLPEGVPHGPELAGGARQISVSGPYYRGPGAPSTGPKHHYVFELYALDSMIDVPAVGASPAETRAAVTAAMAGHIRAKGVLVGLYRRN
jgi:Raf kinase inhibitor-like YbhB/YbcL family protein